MIERAHGGGRPKGRKYTPETITEMRLLARDGASRTKLAARFGCSVSYASKIVRGISYADVPGRRATSAPNTGGRPVKVQEYAEPEVHKRRLKPKDKYVVLAVMRASAPIVVTRKFPTRLQAAAMAGRLNRALPIDDPVLQYCVRPARKGWMKA
jgi:hypothetical protein